jgi:hypothetical protein
VIVVDVDCASKGEAESGSMKFTARLVHSIDDNLPCSLTVDKCDFDISSTDSESGIQNGKGTLKVTETYTIGVADLVGGEAPVKPEPMEDDGGEDGGDEGGNE